jgi:hypothetical protein
MMPFLRNASVFALGAVNKPNFSSIFEAFLAQDSNVLPVH